MDSIQKHFFPRALRLCRGRMGCGGFRSVYLASMGDSTESDSGGQIGNAKTSCLSGFQHNEHRTSCLEAKKLQCRYHTVALKPTLNRPIKWVIVATRVSVLEPKTVRHPYKKDP